MPSVVVAAINIFPYDVRRSTSQAGEVCSQVAPPSRDHSTPSDVAAKSVRDDTAKSAMGNSAGDPRYPSRPEGNFTSVSKRPKPSQTPLSVRKRYKPLVAPATSVPSGPTIKLMTSAPLSPSGSPRHVTPSSLRKTPPYSLS